MIGTVLLETLRCPLTGQRLKPAPEPLVLLLETERCAGRLRDQSGNAVNGKILDGLIREDHLAFYPIRDGIPVMLECIPVSAML